MSSAAVTTSQDSFFFYSVKISTKRIILYSNYIGMNYHDVIPSQRRLEDITQYGRKSSDFYYIRCDIMNSVCNRESGP